MKQTCWSGTRNLRKNPSEAPENLFWMLWKLRSKAENHRHNFKKEDSNAYKTYQIPRKIYYLQQNQAEKNAPQPDFYRYSR